MIEVADSREAGMDQDALTRLDASIQADIDAGLNFGAAVLVARGGKVVHRSLFGAVAPGRPAAVDDIYFLMSMSKSFTAVLALRAIEQGLFSLDTRIDDVLPGFGVRGKAQATVGQLLCHTAGLPFALVAPPLPLTRLGRLKIHANAICQLKAAYKPGTRCVYTSGLGYDALGQIIVNTDPKRRHFRQIAQDEIFTPLGMADSSVGLASDHPRRVKVSWTPQMHGLSSDMIGQLFNETLGAETEFPSGNVMSTIDDVFRFTEALIGRAPNGYRLLSPETFAKARQNQTGGLSLDVIMVDAKLAMLRQILGTVGWRNIFSVMRAARAARGGEGAAQKMPVYPANFTHLGGYVRGEGDYFSNAGKTASSSTIVALGGASTAWIVDTERDLTFIFLSAGFIEGPAHGQRVARLADLAIAAVKK